MNIVYILLLVITLGSFAFLVPAVFAMKKIRRTRIDEVENIDLNKKCLEISSKLQFRFRLFLIIGIIDVIVLFVSR